MSTPRDRLPVYVQFDIERYLSYGWKPSLIRSMIFRRHAYRITHACISSLRDGSSCPAKCDSHCWIMRVAKPIPNREWLETLRRKTAPSTPMSRYGK